MCHVCHVKTFFRNFLKKGANVVFGTIRKSPIAPKIEKCWKLHFTWHTWHMSPLFCPCPEKNSSCLRKNERGKKRGSVEIYIEMPKFLLSLSECDTIFKKWLYVLKNIDVMEQYPMKNLEEQIFKQLKSAVELERMTMGERLAYELNLQAERDWLVSMRSSYEDGKKEVAASMKQKGCDTQLIMECTGLDAEAIAAL